MRFFPTIVHPAAQLASSTVLGQRSIVLAGAVTTADVRVGAPVLIMPHVVLTDDDWVDDYVTLAAGVCLAGLVTVEDAAYVGSRAVVRERRTLGTWSLTGIGAVVTSDVPARVVWAGCPARFLRNRDPSPRSRG